MAYKLSNWSLADLFPAMDSPELENAFDQMEEQVTTFEGVRGKLRSDMPVDEFLHIVRVSEQMTRLAHKMDAYSGLAFAAETQDQPALTLLSRV